MSIAHLYGTRAIYCPVCHKWTHVDEWDEWEDDETEECYVSHECDYVNGPTDGPPRSRPL